MILISSHTTNKKTKPLIAEWFLRKNVVLDDEARGDAEVRERAMRIPRSEDELAGIPGVMRCVLLARIRIDVHADVTATDDAQILLVVETWLM